MADRITGVDVKAICDEAFDKLAVSRERVQAARDLLAGKTRAPLPGNLKGYDPEQFRQSSPQKFTLPLKLMNTILRKSLAVKRYPVGESPRAQTVATRIEQPMQAVMDLLYPDSAATDLLLNEGEGAVVILPYPADWKDAPDSLYAEDNTTIRRRYQRDRQGRAASDEEYTLNPRRTFRPDTKQSQKTQQAEYDDWIARRIPLRIEALSRLECTPMNPVIKGDRVEIDGLCVKREFSTSRLRRRYFWGTAGAAEPMSDSATKSLTLYELWALDEDGYPYVSYCIDGQPTRFRDETLRDVPDKTWATIDLSPYCCRLPVVYQYGWSFPGVSNADDRAVPFVNPFGRTWMGIDTLMTAKVYHGYRTGFTGWFLEYDAAALAEAGMEGALPPHFEIPPNEVVPVPGRVVPSVHPGTGGDIDKLLAVMSAQVESELPSEQALGAGSSSSGFERQVAAGDALGAQHQVIEGRRRMYAETASIVFEVLSRLGERHDEPVRVYANVPIPTEQPGRQSAERRILQIDPELAGDVYEIEAEYVKQPGENLALRQQNFDLVQKSLMPLRKALEADGDPAPEVTIAEIEYDKVRQSDIGQARILELMAKIAGDEEMQQLLEAQAAAKAGPNGAPAGSFAGLTPPPMAPSLPGLAQPNVAASAEGGIIAGQMNSSALAQGVGTLPGVPPPIPNGVPGGV